MQTDQALREQLKATAVSRFGNDIYPIGGGKSFDDCFSLLDGHTVFWFNTPDQSSHIVSSKEFLNSQKGFQNADQAKQG